MFECDQDFHEKESIALSETLPEYIKVKKQAVAC